MFDRLTQVDLTYFLSCILFSNLSFNIRLLRTKFNKKIYFLSTGLWESYKLGNRFKILIQVDLIYYYFKFKKILFYFFKLNYILIGC
jgi:hypothetical protein